MKIQWVGFVGALLLMSCGGSMAGPQRASPVDPSVGNGASVNTTGGNGNSQLNPQGGAPVGDPNNKPPNVESIPDKTAMHGLSMALTVSASDPEMDIPLTYELTVQGDVFKANSNTTGVFFVDVPEDIGTGVVQAIVTVADTKGKVTTVPFRILTQGKPGANPLVVAVNAVCEKLTDPIQKATCVAVGSLGQ